MVTTKQYDNLNRLMQISNTGGTGSTLSSFTYTYNDANQRVRVTLADGSYWLYEYDRLGQVIAGRKYWSDGTPVAGQQFEYGFDDIGNRKVSRRGGDGNGWNLRESLYSANLLNQYSQRTVPGYVDILGVAFATNLVYVNDQIANRKGEYFWKELSMNNTTGSVWQQVTVTATGLTTVTGNVFVAKTPEVFSYDLDGNMTSDGRWNYTWDAENRLIKVESRPDTPSSSWRRIEWTFDALGRRIQQVTSIWTNNSWFVVENLKFVSDPMLFGRHIVELNGTNNTLVRSYAWGLDLSGTMDGAGGVGGLLWVTLHTASGSASGTHFTCYDGDGNIVALVCATTGDVTARYEYGSFGEPIRVSGPAATPNPFRFSTKRTDPTIDLVLYEYRGYQPNTGRWLNRDPLEEERGRNLYGFVGNDPIRLFDRLGLDYYIKIVKGTCGVNHRVLVGDDGNGNSFEVEIYPVVNKWYHQYRRLCGEGIIKYTPRPGSATNWLSGEGVTIEKHERATREQDAAIAAKAKSLDGKSITYCLFVQDCRSIEDCVLWGTISERIKDLLELLWDIIMEQVNEPWKRKS